MRGWALLVTALALGTAARCATLPPDRGARAEPSIAHHPALPLGRPQAVMLRNRDGSPRIGDLDAWHAFWRDVAPRLERWAADPRIALNPNFVAALLVKESGFEPLAISSTPALGIAQLTRAADLDLRSITRDAAAWQWLHEEVSAWPRSPAARAAGVTRARLESLIASGALDGHSEFLFDPITGTRAALLWLRLLVTAWTEDEWPGAHGSFARDRLNGGAPLTDSQILDLVTASYNRGHPHVRELLEQHGREWREHLNEEAADHLERVRAYTVIFQQAVR